MEALSKRGAQNIGIYIGHLPVSLTEVVDNSNWIDLSFAENYTIRKEVLNVFREAAAKNVTGKDLNWPYSFWGKARLLTALSSLLNRYFAPFNPVENKDVVLTSGAAGSLDGLAWSLCDLGEGVLIPCPYHAGAYEVFLSIHTGAVPVPIPVGSIDEVFGEGMIPTLEEGLRNAPVLIKAMFCQRYNLYLISDEVFALSEHGCNDLSKPRKFTSAILIDTTAQGFDPTKIYVI